MTYSFSYWVPVCCSMSSSNCWFLTCIQISQEAGEVVWYSHLLKNFPQFVVTHTVKGFGVVNKADVFLELSCFFNDPTDVDSLMSGSSAFSKSSLNIWKVTVHVLLKPFLCSVQLLSHVPLFATPWTAARQASCPSPTPGGVYSNSCPLSRWCHPTISSSVVPFSSCPPSFPASGSFQMSQYSVLCIPFHCF